MLLMISLQNSVAFTKSNFPCVFSNKIVVLALTKDFHLLFIRLKDQIIKRHLKFRADLHLFQKRFVIGWKNSRDGDITIPVSLKTIGSAGYRDQ